MKTEELKSKIITQLRFHRVSGKHEDLTADHLVEIMEEYHSQPTESKELPGDDKVNNQAKVSCKGNSHAMRYHHMLEQFRDGAKWMRSIASPLLASKDARIRELEEANKLAEIKIAELIELNLTPTKN